MKTKETEKELLRRLKQGDREAFDAIYERWGGYVYNFTCKTLFNKSLAEDITAEDADYIISSIPPVIERLRAMSPLWEKIVKEEQAGA